MKKNQVNCLSGVFLISTVLIILSCERDSMDSRNQLDPNIPISISQMVLSGVQMVDGVLVFESQETFDRILSSLEQGDVSNKSNDNELQLFEQSLSFKSLRAKIAEEEEIWLNNHSLDFSKDPDNHHIVGDELRTLINEDGEIAIGLSIFKIYPEWEVAEIENLNFQTLEELRGLDIAQVRNREDCVMYNSPSHLKASSSCKANHSDTEYNNYKTNYQSKCRLTITNAPFIHFVKGETTNYKMNSNGNWRKERCDHEIAIGGRACETGCNPCVQFDNSDDADNKKSFSVKRSFNYAVRAQNNEIASSHYIDGSFVEHIILNW